MPRRGTCRVVRWGAVLLVAVVQALLAPPAWAEQEAAPLDRRAVEEIVRQYILDHPEVLVQSLQAFQERQQARERERVAAVVTARRNELLGDPTSPVGGNPKGDVTVVEFFDYRCGYCRQMAPTVKQLVAEDRNVRVVYKEFPILGPESLLAARAALASRDQGKYEAFHAALMAAKGPLSMAEILRIAGEVKLDTVKLRAAMDAPGIQAAIQKNFALAEALGIRGTPAFVIGTELVPGAVDLSTLKALVVKARGR